METEANIRSQNLSEKQSYGLQEKGWVVFSPERHGENIAKTAMESHQIQNTECKLPNTMNMNYLPNYLPNI